MNSRNLFVIVGILAVAAVLFACAQQPTDNTVPTPTQAPSTPAPAPAPTAQAAQNPTPTADNSANAANTAAPDDTGIGSPSQPSDPGTSDALPTTDTPTAPPVTVGS